MIVLFLENSKKDRDLCKLYLLSYFIILG